MSMVKVSALPTKFPWGEGEDYTVLDGAPVMGDPVRIRDVTGETFVTYTPITADPQPLPPKPLTRLGFVRLCQSAGGMTDANLVSAKGDAVLAALWIKLDLAQEVLRDDPDTAAGLAGLAALGYLPNGVPAVIAAWPT